MTTLTARSARRWQVLAAVSAVASLAVASAAVVTTVVGAEEKERVTLVLNETLQLEYEPIPAFDPSGETALAPEDCNTSPSCDRIPFTVPEYDIGGAGEAYISIFLNWDTVVVDNQTVVLSGDNFSVNDMDFYVYNDPVVEDAGPDEDGVLASGATLENPEFSYLFDPEPGDYQIQVNNYNGPNSGYRLSIGFFTDDFQKPFEKLAPPPAGLEPFAAPSEDAPAPSRPEPVINEAPADVALPPAPAVADDDIHDIDFGGDEAFEDSLEAPGLLASLGREEIRPDPEDPSTLALVLWLVALPLAGVSAGAWWFGRRSKGLLQL